MKILAAIGLIAIILIITSIIGTILAMIDVIQTNVDELKKREKWSRSLDEKEKE